MYLCICVICAYLCLFRVCAQLPTHRTRHTCHHRNIIPSSPHFLPHHQNISYNLSLPIICTTDHTHSSDAQVRAPSTLTACPPPSSRTASEPIAFAHLPCPPLSQLCLTHIHSFVCRISIVCTSQHRNSCPIRIKHVSCVSQHVASIQVQTDAFAFSASRRPPCYSLRFSDQGVSSLGVGFESRTRHVMFIYVP